MMRTAQTLASLILIQYYQFAVMKKASIALLDLMQLIKKEILIQGNFQNILNLITLINFQEMIQ